MKSIFILLTTLFCGVGVYYFGSESLEKELETLSSESIETSKEKPLDEVYPEQTNKPTLNLSERRMGLYQVQENALNKGFKTKKFECDSNATQCRIVMHYTKKDFDEIDGVLLLKKATSALKPNYALSFVTTRKPSALEAIISFHLIQ